MTKRIPLLAIALACACKSGAPFEGLAPAHDTGGPRVQFDLTRRPFPEIPFPNDLLARPDSTSPTGVRVNASLVAPTQIERNLRSQLDRLDGFGTFAPITVAFDPGAADLDVLGLFARQNDGDSTNDAAYVVDVQTGNTIPLDFGAGLRTRFPLLLPAPIPYFTNDPFAATTNLLFPTSGPFANLLHPPDPSYGGIYGSTSQQDDDLLQFYERSTHTLILRPLVPLDPAKTYAVILTLRLTDVNGRAVMAPGTGINHPAQTEQLRPVLSHLPAGAALEDIAYLWGFTTQSTTREMELLQAGLNGSGPFARLSVQFPVAGASQFANVQQTAMQLLPERDGGNPGTPFPYVVTPAELEPLLTDLAQNPITAPALAPLTAADLPALFATFQSIDYFVSGTFFTADLLTQTDLPAQDSTFQINTANGNARAVSSPVTFLLAVPKSSAAHKPPFPVVIAGHRFGTSRIESLAFAGTFASYGLATIAIDAYGHGIGLDPTFGQPAFQALAAQHGLGNLATALLKTRAVDLDGDGTPDPGADFFVANAFHTRDAVRQTAIDWMQIARLLRVFDGVTLQLVGAAQATTFGGDFNFDGIPDVGGPPVFPVDINLVDQNGNPIQPPVYKKGDANPGSNIYVFGQSIGGMVAGIVPALEPAITAAVPASASGGIADMLLRTQAPPALSREGTSVFLEELGPFFATCPYSASSATCSPSAPDAQSTLVMVVRNLDQPERDLPIAPLVLQQGDTVSVRNLAQVEESAPCTGNVLDGCATAAADASGAVRVAFAADAPLPPHTATTRGDPLRVEIHRASGQVEMIDKFSSPLTFQGVSYSPGDPLTAVGRGFGRTRNTPELRRLMQLVATVLEPGDPVSYAPHWFGSLLNARSNGGVPAPALVIGSVGDPEVPVSTAIAMARAAGLVEMKTVDPAFGKPIDQVLVDSGVVEGVARTGRFANPAQGPIALLPGHVRCDTAGSCSGTALLDPTGYSCNRDGSSCTDGFAAPRLNPTLQEQLERTTPIPGRPAVTSALLLPYLAPGGQHGFLGPQPQKPFDIDQFLANVIGRWFETAGAQLRLDPCQAQPPGSCP